MPALDITEVARRSGVPASTLRFYEEKKLISSIGRRGLRRLFDPRVVERLAFIALGRASGFSLNSPRRRRLVRPTLRRTSAVRLGTAKACEWMSRP